MEDTEKERQPMKPAKVPFDESKLTPPQRQALEIAKAQGAPFSRRLEDLVQDVEPEAANKLIETIMELRRDGRGQLPRNPLDE